MSDRQAHPHSGYTPPPWWEKLWICNHIKNSLHSMGLLKKKEV